MRTKGVSIVGVLRSLRALHGPDVHDAVVGALPPELRDPVQQNAILTGSWYPIAWYQGIHATAQRVTGRGPDLARDLARRATLDDFRGIYRLLTFVLSPEGLLRKAPSAWSRYYDAGRVEILEARNDFAQVRFSGCDGFDASLWEDTIGGCMGVLEACGAKEIQVELLAGGRDGDSTMEVTSRWRK